MSAINKFLTIGQNVLEKTGHVDFLTVITGRDKGTIVPGVMDIMPVLDPDAGLGSDPRMQTVYRIIRDNVPALNAGDKLTDDGTGIKWRVLKMEDNVSTVTIDFWLEQLTEYDDKP